MEELIKTAYFRLDGRRYKPPDRHSLPDASSDFRTADINEGRTEDAYTGGQGIV